MNSWSSLNRPRVGQFLWLNSHSSGIGLHTHPNNRVCPGSEVFETLEFTSDKRVVALAKN